MSISAQVLSQTLKQYEELVLYHKKFNIFAYVIVDVNMPSMY